MNLPVGIATIALAAVVMPDLKLNRRHRLDWLGTVLATIGLFLLTYGLIEGQPHNWGAVWGPITIPMVMVGGVVVLAVFLWHQYAERDREPLVPFAIFKDRNFSLMNFAAAAMGFAMLGLFLPIVIYLQSVLGLTALQAGLAIAPMSVISMFVAPVAGRLSDRFGGKYFLLAGVSLFALGMAILIASSHVDSTRLHLLPGLLVAGLGMGLTFAPMQTIAMRNIQPHMADAASALINTTRQLGAVIGSSAVGALLQARLANGLRETAVAQAGSLPLEYRDRAVQEFTNAATGGLEVGAGQTGVEPPPGLPEQAVAAIKAFAEAVFTESFTDAMRVTLILPIAMLAVTALSCLLIKRRARPAGPLASTPPAAPVHAATATD